MNGAPEQNQNPLTSHVDGPNTDSVGETFGPYRLMGTIASGGMAELFLAVKGDRGVSKTVAIKRILQNVSSKEEFVELFTHEAKLTVRLEHPNIVRTTDFGQVDGQFYLAMEYLAGEDLQRVVKTLRRQNVRAPVDIAVAICESVTSGLAYAHSLTDSSGHPLKLIHRDVSPSNVVVTYQGVTKLVDFGIARFEGGANNTRTGAVRGKIAYLAPECFTGGSFDGRADVWSVGCLLWELLTGERLFRAEHDAALMNAVLTNEIPYLGDQVPDLDPGLAEIVHRCLARDVNKRFRTADELGDALDVFLENNGGRPSAKRISGWMGELFGVDRAAAKLDVASGTRLDIAMPKVLKQMTQSSATGSSRSRPGSSSSTHSRQPTGSVSKRTLGTTLGVSAVALALVIAGFVVVLSPSTSSSSERTQQPKVAAGTGVRLTIESTPPGAMLFVDDMLTGLKTPAELSSVSAGKSLRVRLEMPGYKPAERVVTPSGTGSESFTLEKQQSKVQLTALPVGAVLLVDGRVTPIEVDGSVLVPLGSHSFQAQVDGRVVATTRADITGQVATISFK